MTVSFHTPGRRCCIEPPTPRPWPRRRVGPARLARLHRWVHPEMIDRTQAGTSGHLDRRRERSVGELPGQVGSHLTAVDLSCGRCRGRDWSLRSRDDARRCGRRGHRSGVERPAPCDRPSSGPAPRAGSWMGRMAERAAPSTASPTYRRGVSRRGTGVSDRCIAWCIAPGGAHRPPDTPAPGVPRRPVALADQDF